jgi:hypothetical protein
MSHRQRLWRLVKNGTPLQTLLAEFGNEEKIEDLAHYLKKYGRLQDLKTLSQHPAARELIKKEFIGKPNKEELQAYKQAWDGMMMQSHAAVHNLMTGMAMLGGVCWIAGSPNDFLVFDPPDTPA